MFLFSPEEEIALRPHFFAGEDFPALGIFRLPRETEFGTLGHMSNGVNLEKIREALRLGNAALKKRALAIVFNDAIVEARGLVEEFLGNEPDQSLQNMALQVIRKLEGFENQSQQAAPESVGVLLQSADPAGRVLALRALLNRRDPSIPGLLADFSIESASTEEIGLVAEILKQNPDPRNLAFLLRFSDHASEKIRIDAVEGILNLMHGCMYPHVLKSLLDPAPQIKMKAYKLISKMSRANLLDTLEFMISSHDPEMSVLAGKLFPSFLGPDLVPLLQKHLQHPDGQTVGLIKRALVLMAQKGNPEAVALVEGMAQAGSFAGEKTVEHKLPPECMKLLAVYPQWVSQTLIELPAKVDPLRIIHVVRDVFQRLEGLLKASFIIAYFFFGKRTGPCDKTCFRAFQVGLDKGDTIQILRNLAPALPEPKSDRDVFPLLLGHRLMTDFNDTLLEQIMSFHEIFRVIEENPGEASSFVQPTLDGIKEFLTAMQVLTANILVVKYTDGIALKTQNFLSVKPTPVDPKISANFSISINNPWVIGGDSIRGCNLAPFFTLDPQKRGVAAKLPDEDELWGFLKQHKIIDDYLAFLKNKEA
jgi:hypothetical protein